MPLRAALELLPTKAGFGHLDGHPTRPPAGAPSGSPLCNVEKEAYEAGREGSPPEPDSFLFLRLIHWDLGPKASGFNQGSGTNVPAPSRLDQKWGNLCSSRVLLESKAGRPTAEKAAWI